MHLEASCFRAANLPHRVFCAGGSPGRASVYAERLIEQGANRLLSFGVAGGLDPTLRKGAIILSETIIDQMGNEYWTNSEWRRELRKNLAGSIPVFERKIVTAEQPAISPLEKLKLHQRTGAVAIDMESAGVAYVARNSDIPFLAIRAIADDSSRIIPQCALSGLKEDGSTRPMAVLGSLARHPWELASLLRLAKDTNYAIKILSRVAATGF